jgi:uncharacterized protein
MLALSAAQLQEIKSILASYAAGQGVLAFGSRVYNNDSRPSVKPFADLDLALTGHNLPPAELFILRDAMSQSQLPFRVDICHWDDLPVGWKIDLNTEILQ